MTKTKKALSPPAPHDAIGDAARANVNAAVEVAKSAVGSFIGALTSERKKPRRTKRGSTRNKASSKRAAIEARGSVPWWQTVCCCLKPPSYEKISEQPGKGEAI